MDIPPVDSASLHNIHVSPCYSGSVLHTGGLFWNKFTGTTYSLSSSYLSRRTSEGKIHPKTEFSLTYSAIKTDYVFISIDRAWRISFEILYTNESELNLELTTVSQKMWLSKITTDAVILSCPLFQSSLCMEHLPVQRFLSGLFPLFLSASTPRTNLFQIQQLKLSCAALHNLHVNSISVFFCVLF